MLTPDEIARLEAFLDSTIPDSWGLRIVDHFRIHGGASRETYAIEVAFDAAAGPVQRGLILRRDPDDSLIDTDRALEFAAYRSFHGLVPAPEPIALVADPALLGKPFFIMERIEGGSAASPFQADPYGAHRVDVARQFFTHLGAIARVDPYDTELPGVVDTPDPEQCWARELEYWAGVVAADALEPQPIVEAAIRRLRRNPPPPPQRLSVVHGDYRSGNFLHDGEGRIIAILDWEMAHIGDALEDLAWALDPLWSHGSDLALGAIPRGEAIDIWENASGLSCDPDAMRWWSLFASVKGAAIWLSSSHAFAAGKNTDPVLAFSGWYCTLRHDDIIARRLAAAARGALA
ncbi:MAG: phosphotransferase family protein [Caulobacterales bacterium]